MTKRRKILTIASILLSSLLLVCAAVMIFRDASVVQEVKQDELFPKIRLITNGRVLFLSSYEPTFPSLPHQLEGIDDVFSKENISYDVEFMSAKENNTAADRKIFYKLFQARMKNQGPYGAVLLGDDEALLFALEHRDEFFKDTPMVFFAVNDQEIAAKASEDPYITGEIESTYFTETIAAAARILPEADTVTAIVDDTNTGKGNLEAFEKYADGKTDYTYSVIDASQLSRGSLAEKLRGIDSKTIVLYMSCTSDASGNYYTVAESSDFIGSSCPVPVFRANGGGFGAGITGGMVMDFKKTAGDAAQEIADILMCRKEVSAAQMPQDDDGTFVFDQNQLDRFHISRRLLPEDTVLLNGKVPFINSSNIHLVIPAILLLAAILILLITALITLAHERKMDAEVKRLYENAKFRSEYDQLLGIINRDSSEAKLREKYPGPVEGYVFMADIDDMKNFNDLHGHQTGNDLLKQIADRLKAAARKYDAFLCRYGGDQFLLVMEKENCPGFDVLCDELHDIFLKEYILKNGTSFHLTSSIGAAICTADDDLMRKISDSEIAMFESKKHGKNIITVFRDDMRASMEEEGEIAAIVKDACGNDGFYVVYQPKVSLKDHSLSGFEALCRLKNSSISPGKFIPIAERNGDARQIGRIITEKVIAQLAAWKKEGKKLYPVSVNYSPVQLSDKGYTHFLKKKLDEYGIEPELVELEITESELLSNTMLSGQLFSDLKNFRINILLDDFGSGYTSLAYLSYIPAKYVKLDKSLVDSYLKDNPQTIEDFIRIGKSLGKEIIAEGVEEKWQCDELQALQCDYIQGYFFSRPLPPEQAIDFKAG